MDCFLQQDFLRKETAQKLEDDSGNPQLSEVKTALAKHVKYLQSPH